MERKRTIYICMFIGSTIGGYIPMLWNASLFSVSGVLLAALGGFFGIWFGFTISS